MLNDLPTYNETDNQLIENYLDGILSESSRKEVEKRLQTDTDFAAQFQLHQNIEGILDASEKQELKQNWAELMLEAEEEMKIELPKNPLKVASKTAEKKGNRSFSWLQIAAVILVLLIPTMLYFMGVFDPSANSTERLAMQYFEAPESMTIAKRGGDDMEEGIETLKEEVQAFYEQKDYRNALKVLEQMAAKRSSVNMSQVYFSMGICHFLLRENEEAVQRFLKVSAKDGIKFKANWHLALTYLQQGDTVKAIEILEELAEKDVSVKRKEKAKELLEVLSASKA